MIHAGLYYGESSLKATLCIKGKRLLYDLCAKHGLPHKKIGKWIVAQTPTSMEELQKIHALSEILKDAPTRFVTAKEAAEQEPSVKASAGILESASTGIIDSHALLQCLLGIFEEQGGDVALNSTVTDIESRGHLGRYGWQITAKDSHSGEATQVSTETLINAAGLGACHINNMIMPEKRHRVQYYAKGNYFSYASSHPKVSRLIYPAPEPGLAGLGTHLTIDLAGRIRFGPDVEWIDDPADLAVNTRRLHAALAEIQKYFPHVDRGSVHPDYAGIRPKLHGPDAIARGEGPVDFIIRKESDIHNFVNLLGIESPGLTSSLAIADMVENLLYR